MISGTSKIWSKSGPGDLRIITKMLQELQEKLWHHPGKILVLSIWDIKFFENFRNLYVLGTMCVFSSFFFRFFSIYCLDVVSFFLVFFWVYILKINLRRWGIENYTFSITKQHPNLILNFIYVKKHEMGFTLNFVFSRNVP